MCIIYIYVCVCIRVCVCAHINHPFWHLVNHDATTTQRCLTMEHGTLKCCRGHVFAGHQKEAKDCSEALGPGPFFLALEKRQNGRPEMPWPEILSTFFEKKKGAPLNQCLKWSQLMGEAILGGASISDVWQIWIPNSMALPIFTLQTAESPEDRRCLEGRHVRHHPPPVARSPRRHRNPSEEHGGTVPDAAEMVRGVGGFNPLEKYNCHWGSSKIWLPSGNQTGQWKMNHLSIIFSLKRPFTRDVQLPRLTTTSQLENNMMPALNKAASLASRPNMCDPRALQVNNSLSSEARPAAGCVKKCQEDRQAALPGVGIQLPG